MRQALQGRLSRIAGGIDTALKWLRWPSALFLLLVLIPTLSACVSLLGEIVKTPEPILPFAGGLGLYLVFWTLSIRQWRTTWLSTLEHELTHALFAMLTFHRVVGIRTTWRNGGHVRYLGTGNWLITLAPYFFPTVCMLLLPLFILVPFLETPIGDAVLGAAFAYHVTSTIRETHRGQSDLHKAGFLFCLMVLPGLNLLTHGLVLAWCHGGNAGLVSFVRLVGANLRSLLW
ncbi:MAG: M50 family metallopeptidase [Planctomycetota bacterium]|nr:M50 family metallopeptidase [Planctomycetota bacterium]MDA1251797.1 M50 family metallopeptidase [Planctomycetota bacterium]